MAPRHPARALAALVVLALSTACGRGTVRPEGTPAGAAPTVAPPASLPALAPSSAPLPPSLPASVLPASAAPAPSWLGVAIDPSVRFVRTLRLPAQRDRAYAAEIQVPAGWHVVNLENGQYDETLAYMAIAPEKLALVILLTFEPGLWHETLVNGAAARWLGVSGGVEVQGWDAPVPVEIGAERTPGARVLGRGVLGRGPADLWQVRRRFPSPESGKHALVAAGAVARRAPAARRAEMLACLATFAPTPARP